MFMSIALIPTCTFSCICWCGFLLTIDLLWFIWPHSLCKHCYFNCPSPFPITHPVILFFSLYIPRTLHLISPFFFLSVISPISCIHTYFFFYISFFLSTLPSIHSSFIFLLFTLLFHPFVKLSTSKKLAFIARFNFSVVHSICMLQAYYFIELCRLILLAFRPRSLSIPGSDLENIFLLRSPEDANQIGVYI